jgi:hypothetical protein
MVAPNVAPICPTNSTQLWISYLLPQVHEN